MSESNGNLLFTFKHAKPRLYVFSKIFLILCLLYLFILAITLLGYSFKLMGEGVAQSILHITSHPVTALFIGVLSTAVIQSSSTTTSIVVGLVGTGVISIENAVPIIMGANIGTSVTNTIVSLAHISYKEEFKRAFAGSTVHDFFNICSVIVLIPLEIYFKLISRSAIFISNNIVGFEGLKFTSPINAATKPIAVMLGNIVGNIGWLSAIIALFLLFIALRYIVKILKSLVLVKVERFFHRYIFRNIYLGFLLGIVLTAFVQSSSITTSLIVPLIGAGIISIHQAFPYILGANIGTTVTAFLASFAVNSPAAITIAFAHLIFNLYGIAIFWPLKKIPITLAEKLAELTHKRRIIAILYILITFFVIPGIVILTLR